MSQPGPRPLGELARQVGEYLIQRGWQVTTAESCTGGGVSYWLTSVPGSSAWFEDGFVVYANRSKSQRLGVSSQTLDSFGAVSEPCVRELTEGALNESGADIAVAISGIAGPGGGTEEKPVGLVHFAWQTHERIRVRHEVFPGDRQAVREAAIRMALEGLIGLLESG